VIGVASKYVRPPAIGLAAVLLCGLPAAAQDMSYAERLQGCHTCHGEDGNSKMEKIPSLAGQPAFYILNQLFLMREGVRVVEPMTPFVKGLKDDELDGLSKLFAGLQAKPSGEAIDEAKAKRGAEISNQRRCASCHLPSLAGQDQMARLAKQRIDYMIPTLKSYRDNPRPGADTAMSAAIAGASDADIEALAHFTASK
jgi:cytochrome c553